MPASCLSVSLQIVTDQEGRFETQLHWQFRTLQTETLQKLYKQLKWKWSDRFGHKRFEVIKPGVKVSIFLYLFRKKATRNCPIVHRASKTSQWSLYVNARWEWSSLKTKFKWYTVGKNSKKFLRKIFFSDIFFQTLSSKRRDTRTLSDRQIQVFKLQLDNWGNWILIFWDTPF